MISFEIVVLPVGNVSQIKYFSNHSAYATLKIIFLGEYHFGVIDGIIPSGQILIDGRIQKNIWRRKGESFVRTRGNMGAGTLTLQLVKYLKC